MSYTDLPIEIRFNIFEQLHNIYDDNAKLIQRCWQKYINPQKTIYILWNIFIDNDPDSWCSPTSHLIIPVTSKLLKFTSKVISQKDICHKYKYFLNWVFYSIYESLCKYKYSSGNYDCVIYNEIQQYLHTITKKLNISIHEINNPFKPFL